MQLYGHKSLLAHNNLACKALWDCLVIKSYTNTIEFNWIENLIVRSNVWYNIHSIKRAFISHITVPTFWIKNEEDIPSFSSSFQTVHSLRSDLRDHQARVLQRAPSTEGCCGSRSTAPSWRSSRRSGAGTGKKRQHLVKTVSPDDAHIWSPISVFSVLSTPDEQYI